MLPLESTFKHNRRHFQRFSRRLSRLSGGLADYGQTPPHAASLLRIVTPTLICGDRQKNRGFNALQDHKSALPWGGAGAALPAAARKLRYAEVLVIAFLC